VDGEPPTFVSCPADVTVHPDPGEVTATVTWDAIAAADACAGTQDVVCSASHSEGYPIDHLIAGGGLFPIGVASFECGAADECGLSSTCAWTVEVAPTQLLDVEVQLSPTMVPGGLDRCITFELYSSCSEPPVIVERVLAFGLPYNLPGRAQETDIPIPPGDYACITARDDLHTLRARGELEVVDGRYVATFVGDPIFGGHWLPGGNLDGNGAIDIIDFGFLMDQFLMQVPPDTDCDTPPIHADINGDGLVDQIDGVFIMSNLDLVDAPGCCGGPAGAGMNAPILDIRVSELRRRGLSALIAGDLNRDGVLNGEDLRLFLDGQWPTVAKRLVTPAARPGR
jgi:hypothetical protein